jgi:hypothetical protein
MNLLASLANLAWLASNAPACRRFHAALRNPHEAQLKLLNDYTRQNACTDYGKTHRFVGIRNYQDFASQVPLVTYDDLEPWIERIHRGESNVLTCERVTHLVPTSGSTAARKLIPFTAGLQREFNRAIAPWIGELYSQFPSVAFGSAYWSVSPASLALPADESAVPVGFDDDTSYLGGARKRLLAAVTAVPASVRFLNDLETFRYVTLLCLLRRPDLRLISVWHPSFLTLLLEALHGHWDSLLADVESGRCSASIPLHLSQAFNARPMSARARQLRDCDAGMPQSIWPRLRVISCWGDAQAKIAFEALRVRWPQLFIQPKGLLATEAFVTIPFRDQSLLAVRSHFFEFIDAQGRACLADQLQEGGEYEVVVTTGGGLWRYRLGDTVRVTGFVGKTPSLAFIGRKGNMSDHFGEKLSEAFVCDVIQQLTSELRVQPVFAMLAPDHDSAGRLHYVLFLETDMLVDCAERLDALLRRNPHYDYCRKLGQLGPARTFHVPGGGYETFTAEEMRAGKKLGEIKPCLLSRKTGWLRRFTGGALETAAAGRA